MNTSPPSDPIGREETIFNAAVELRDLAKRATYLELACDGDRALRARLEKMLAADGDSFFEKPIPAPSLADAATLAASASPVAEPVPLAEHIGRYKLLQKIGEGGCGIVYMAEQEEPVRRRVALKVIKLGMDTKSVIARFESERQALAMMDHPNIAKVLDGGATDAGRPYFVMELVRGIKITEYCDEAKLSTRDRLDLFIKVCQAIQHAHQKGIIHRDIKPSNILVTINDGVAVPKVIDFGIAKATEGRLTDKTLFTQFEALMGTPAYMSPEQAVMTSLDIDTRSDIYSLGVLLYELLAGSTPFDAKELMASGIDAMRKTIREKEPLRPSTKLSQTLVGADVRRLKSSAAGETTTEEEVRASSRRLLQLKETIALLRGDLDWIVMKCLEKDRARRYETANGLASDLQRHLNNEAVLARPPSAAYRFQKMVKRNKLAFAAVSAVTLTLIAGLSFSTWAFLSEAAQRRTAVEQRTKAEAAQASEAEQRTKADAEKIAAQRQLYVANMNLAQASWEQNQVSRARELLEETVTAPERGFEWYYWQRQMHLERMALRGHTGPILAVAYSPDGHRIVTGSADHTAKLWDSDTGQELLRLEGHTAPVSSVAFSTNGLRIMSGSWDKTAKAWDAVTGRPLVTLNGHEGAIFSVAFSPDGLRAVTGSQDKTARVWDANSGKELRLLTGHTDHVLAVGFSSGGQWIVSGSWDKTAKVWNATTGEELRTLTGHSGAVFSAAFSPFGQWILTGSQDSRVKLWDAVSGTNLFTLKGHSGTVFSVGFSRDGTRIITSGEDQTVRLWNAANGEETHVLKGHGSRIGSAAFSPDGQRIVTGGGAMQFDPSGRFFGSFTEDQAAKVWNIADAGEGSTLEGHEAAVSSVEFSPNGRIVASGSFDGTARLWDLGTRREVLKLAGHGAAVRTIAFFRDGRRLVTGSFDHTAKVWEIATGKELLTLAGHTAEVFSVAVSPDGRWIATGSWDNTVKLWDASTGTNFNTLLNDGGFVYSVVFSPDGGRIVSASARSDDGPGRITQWAVRSGKELLAFQNSGKKIWSAAFSDDGRRILTGTYGLTANVWDAATGKEELTLKGHTAHIHAAVYSPDGGRIVTGSADQTAKLWDAATGKELLTFRGHTHWIFSVAFSPDGQRIATGSRDHTVKVWEAATPEQVSKWQLEERSAGIAGSLDAAAQKRTEVKQP